MRYVALLAIGGVATLILTPGLASAQTLIFDNSAGTTQGGTNRTPNGANIINSPLAQITIGATAKTISNIAVNLNLSANGNIKFLIFDGNAPNSSTLLYSSAAKAFNTGQQWAISDAFSYTLQANTTYYIGGIADITAIWNTDDTVNSQNGITSVKPNGNASNFATPGRISNGPGGASLADIHVRLYEPSSLVPEPGTLALLGVGIVGLGMWRRRVKTV